jgi:hypothetical protein
VHEGRKRGSKTGRKGVDFRVGEKALELEDVGDFRAAPAVDGLIVIADDAYMGRRADELLEQAHLQGVRVLELIDGDAGVELAEMLADVAVLAQDLLGEDEEIVEIHGVLRAEFVLVSDRELCKIIVAQTLEIDPLFLRFGKFC